MGKIKTILSSKKLEISNYIFYAKHHKSLSSIKDNEVKGIIIGTPEYGNLGDQLIALGELKLFEDLYGKGNVLEITENDLRYRFKDLKKYFSSNVNLAFQGGGNISDVWKDQEFLREKVISSFPDLFFWVMPQTVYISNAGSYESVLDKYRKNSIVISREKKTYEILEMNGIKTKLCPDIALYLYDYCNMIRSSNNYEKSGIAICLRDDSEAVSDGYKEKVLDYMMKRNENYELFSTVLNEFISSFDRKSKICEVLNYISKKDLIITDRLHAMIMAYLVGTACIALPNSNGKVKGTYEWISNADNIAYVEDVNEALELVECYKGKVNNHSFEHKQLFKEIFS